MSYVYFHLNYTATILVEQWSTTGTWDLFGSCLAVFVLAILYEGLKVFREVMLRSALINVRYNTSGISKNKDTVLVETKGLARTHFCSCSHFLQTFLHIIQTAIGYCLMLVVMTFNLWLTLSIVFGAGAGYFVFGWRKSIVVDINESLR
ncbi:High affinity copper uptake protein 1 [Holothuria leucospilota]|uniref:Copper transport protein n=1 Tax=Holothuria leucospilota TaxID=206669 RepID=A0A9Q1C727_HOLLE|nr:High affinity copper uptake protein 1 [Holothuria leucospilota]